MNKDLFKVGKIVLVEGICFGRVEKVDGIMLFVRGTWGSMNINTEENNVLSFNYDLFHELFSGTQMTDDYIFEVLKYLENSEEYDLVRFESENEDNDICITEDNEDASVEYIMGLLICGCKEKYTYSEKLSEKIQRTQKAFEDVVREQVITLVNSQPIKSFYNESNDSSETIDTLYDSGLLDADTYVVTPSVFGDFCIIGYNNEGAIMVKHEDIIGYNNELKINHIEFKHLTLDNMYRLVELIEKN